MLLKTVVSYKELIPIFSCRQNGFLNPNFTMKIKYLNVPRKAIA